MRPLIDEIQTTGRATIVDCAARMESSAGEVVGWANQENKALIELFSEYAASLEGGQLDQVTAIEGLESLGLSAETAQTICTKPGRVLEAGGTLALSLDAVVHGHRAASAHSEGESGTPATHQGELQYRVGPKGIAGSDQGYGVSAARVESLLRSRQ